MILLSPEPIFRRRSALCEDEAGIMQESLHIIHTVKYKRINVPLVTTHEKITSYRGACSKTMSPVPLW
jgi:hypothetical protein